MQWTSAAPLWGIVTFEYVCVFLNLSGEIITLFWQTFWIFLKEEEGCTMLQMEKNSRTRLELMQEHKKQRMEELKGLISKDTELCGILCTTPFCIDQNSIPSLQQLKTYHAYLDDLTKEKVLLTACFS